VVNAERVNALRLVRASAAIGAMLLALPFGARAATEPTLDTTDVGSQPNPTSEIAPYVSDLAGERALGLTRSAALALLRSRVKYVFVLFQENRSFDSYFGSFPGARNLFSQPPAATPGYAQTILDTDGTARTITPFRIGPAEFASDLDDVDHSFKREGAKMDILGDTPRMDDYALEEERKYVTLGARPSLRAKQYGELTMAYEDCDTVPFLWNYASRFTLFDNFFQHTIGPSTPNAIAMIAGQTGETQWLEHPDQANDLPLLHALGQGEPVITDNDPFWGSSADPTTNGRQPINPRDIAARYTLNQTYASLPLTFNARDVAAITAFDRMSQLDLADVRQDIPAIAALQGRAIPWGWYQEGYDREVTDASPGAVATHASYIGHHNGPQYFGYVANNPQQTVKLHGLGDFFSDVASGALPTAGGVFYVRGGFKNIAGLRPADPDPDVQKNFAGDDDHPGYSDSQISEALVAREVNAIARSPYWKQSAIVYTYDESEGDYDHVPPQITEFGPGHRPLSRGPRIPLIVISPFARAHAVSHESGDHNSIIRFLDEVYGLPFLADLPDEARARELGRQTLGQAYLGPQDDGVPGVGDLLSAFDLRRLAGRAPELPAAYATIDDKIVNALPHYGDHGCRALGITPDDVAHGVTTHAPADFNPRPSTNPSAPGL
jgi:phospholipase C